MMTILHNATILLTGAAGGFGQEMIRQFLGVNGRLILTDMNQAALAETAQSIASTITTGEIIACFATDLATVAGCQRLYQFYQSLDLPLDVLVNNAGVATYGRFDETPADQWERLIQVNLLAPMRLIHLFMPDMIRRGQGHIVNMASIAGWAGTAGLATYTTSKYGLRGFSEALAEELAPHRVRVSAVYPFFSRTPILDSPRFGSLQPRALPDNMVSDPTDVIHEVIRGIEQNKQHIFPDRTARRIHILKRYLPGLLHHLNRYILT